MVGIKNLLLMSSSHAKENPGKAMGSSLCSKVERAANEVRITFSSRVKLLAERSWMMFRISLKKGR